MRKLAAGSPWLAAILSWAVAVLLVTVGYGVWLRSQGEPFHWSILRDAALFAAPVALLRAWRDSRPRRE
jgi:hypothetical protein